MQHWHSSPSHGSTWSVLRSKQTSKLNTISDQDGLMLDITSRDLLSWLDSETTKQLSQTHHPDNDTNQDIVFKLVERPPCHRRTPPHRSRPCQAWSDGSWSAPWSTSAARRALSPGGDRVSMNSSSQKLVLRKMWHIAKKANCPPSLLVPPPPALPWGRRASFWAAFWLRGEFDFEEPNLMRTLF